MKKSIQTPHSTPANTNEIVKRGRGRPPNSAKKNMNVSSQPSAKLLKMSTPNMIKLLASKTLGDLTNSKPSQVRIVFRKFFIELIKYLQKNIKVILIYFQNSGKKSQESEAPLNIQDNTSIFFRCVLFAINWLKRIT